VHRKEREGALWRGDVSQLWTGECSIPIKVTSSTKPKNGAGMGYVSPPIAGGAEGVGDDR